MLIESDDHTIWKEDVLSKAKSMVEVEVAFILLSRERTVGFRLEAEF